MTKLKILKSGEWDLLAVAVASILGIIGHLLHIIPEGYVISLILLLLALHALHEIGHDMKFNETHTAINDIEKRLSNIEPEVKVITKNHFLEGEKLAQKNRGNFIWFNTPMTVMRSQKIFNLMLKPAIESKDTKRIEFILRPHQKEFFDKEVWPKVQETKGKERVSYPIFTDIKENFGFKLIDASEIEEKKEGHLTFLDKPFTITRERKDERDVIHPKILFHMMPGSELAKQLHEIYLGYKMD